jgi:hypothetical protein
MKYGNDHEKMKYGTYITKMDYEKKQRLVYGNNILFEYLVNLFDLQKNRKN